ncbi:MAG: DUF1223 domain-containing protein [Lacipirellulaceae bacterium]
MSLRFVTTLTGFTAVAAAAFVVLAPASRASAQDASETTVQADDGAPRGFAVVELFTSEGCSSCPPADRLLAEIGGWGDQNHLQVYPLSFHVDYWNDLGWTDPFSSGDYSDRQRRYAATAGERGVYTPQMIVNGREGFVGSDKKRAAARLQSTLAEAPTAVLVVEASSISNGDVEVSYRATGLDAGVVVNVALVQPSADQVVAKGENGGRTLGHVNVVRAFRTVSVDPSGAGAVSLPRPTDLAGPTEVVVYAQEPATGRIIAAAKTGKL